MFKPRPNPRKSSIHTSRLATDDEVQNGHQAGASDSQVARRLKPHPSTPVLHLSLALPPKATSAGPLPPHQVPPCPPNLARLESVRANTGYYGSTLGIARQAQIFPRPTHASRDKCSQAVSRRHSPSCLSPLGATSSPRHAGATLAPRREAFRSSARPEVAKTEHLLWLNKPRSIPTLFPLWDLWFHLCLPTAKIPCPRARQAPASVGLDWLNERCGYPRACALFASRVHFTRARGRSHCSHALHSPFPSKGEPLWRLLLSTRPPDPCPTL